MCLYIKKKILDPCLMLILGTGDTGAGVLVARGGARDDHMALINCLERVSCAKVSFSVVIIVSYLCLIIFFKHYTCQNLRICSKSHTFWS
jgi:hypothetical protein